MTDKIPIRLLPAGPILVWSLLGVGVATGGFSIGDTQIAAVWSAAGFALLLVYLFLLAFRGVRKVAVISLLVLLAGAPTALIVHGYRYRADVRKLEAIYETIAARGSPFPESIDRASFDAPEQLHWYYQKNSEDSFAVVYVVSSDGYAMEHPLAEWHYVGYRPNGYEYESEAGREQLSE